MTTPFRHPAPATPTTGYVLFRGSAPSAEAIVETLTPAFGDQISRSELQVQQGPSIDTVVLKSGPMTALIAPVASRLNPELIRRTVHPAWWGPNGDDALTQDSHVIVTVMHGIRREDARIQGYEEAGLWSAVAARVAQMSGAVSVIEVTPNISVPASRYVEVVTTGRATEEMPVDLWASVWTVPGSNPGTATVFTRGLAGFGHADLMIRDSEEDLGQAIRILGALARMIILQGARLNAGESIGVSDMEQRGVVAAASPYHGDDVLEVGPPRPMAV